MPRGSMGAMPLVQEEIFAAERRDAGVFKNEAGEVLVRGKPRGGGVVLRIPRTSPGAEMDASGLGSDAEQEPGSAIEVSKHQAVFSAGIFRIDRLVRIAARLSRPKFPEISHAISGDLAFQFGFHLLTKFSSGGAINCNDKAGFSKLIARPMGVRSNRSETILCKRSVAILHPQLRVS